MVTPRVPRSALIWTALATGLFLIGAILFFTFSVNRTSVGNRSVWNAAVRAELASHPTASFQGPPVHGYSNLPGVGRINWVTVYPPSSHGDQYTVIFWIGAVNSDEQVAYVSHSSRPYDTCDKSLGSGWLRIEPMNSEGMCPRGFLFAPGP
jgi:hypothetical protein